MWFGPLKRIQNLFIRTPLVNLFIFGSEAYHDYYRWPFKDKRIFETWRGRPPGASLPAVPQSTVRSRGTPA